MGEVANMEGYFALRRRKNEEYCTLILTENGKVTYCGVQKMVSLGKGKSGWDVVASHGDYMEARKTADKMYSSDNPGIGVVYK